MPTSSRSNLDAPQGGTNCAASATVSTLTIMTLPPWEPVREAARGDRTDYRLDHRPLAEPGGQGVVFRAVHKSSGTKVAMKKVLDHSLDSIARMRREIDVAGALQGHRRVMPVLDASPESDWFVMPLAERSAADRHAALGEDNRLRRLVEAVCDGLGAAHALGWVHRDIKPENILYLERRWVVADWGLGRRPRGETTVDRRTRTGVFLGTERFAAPELADDAHEATFSADVYSVGQLIGWAVTGQLPLPFQPLVPASGPWRGVVRAATRYEPSRRPQTIEELLDLVVAELSDPPAAPANAGEELVNQVRKGDDQAATELWRLAAGHSDDYDLLIEVLPDLPDEAIMAMTTAEPELTLDIVKGMHVHLDDTGGRRLSFSGANAVVKSLLAICRRAARDTNWTLLEDSADAMFAWDGIWDQWNARDAIVAWLYRIDGEVARVVAGALRRNVEARAHFESLAEDRRVDRLVRAALAPRPPS